MKPISGQNVAGAASINFEHYWDLGRANIALNKSTISRKGAYCNYHSRHFVKCHNPKNALFTGPTHLFKMVQFFTSVSRFSFCRAYFCHSFVVVAAISAYNVYIIFLLLPLPCRRESPAAPYDCLSDVVFPFNRELRLFGRRIL